MTYFSTLRYLKREFECSVKANGVDPSYVVKDVETGNSSPPKKYPSTAWKTLLEELNLKKKKEMSSLDGNLLFGFRSKEFEEETKKLKNAELYNRFLEKRGNESPRKPSPKKNGKQKPTNTLSPVSDLSSSSEPEKQPPGSPQNSKTAPPKKELFPSDKPANKKLDERRTQHTELQTQREVWWKAQGIDCEKDTKVHHDICVKKNGGVIVEEIKSLDSKKEGKEAKADQRKQVRLALGQLCDYKQQLEKHNFKFIQMMAVFSYEIQERYKVLLERHNIGTSWLTKEGHFEGTSEADRIVDAFTSKRLQQTEILKRHLLECEHCSDHQQKLDSNAGQQSDEEKDASESEDEYSSEEDSSSSESENESNSDNEDDSSSSSSSEDSSSDDSE